MTTSDVEPARRLAAAAAMLLVLAAVVGGIVLVGAEPASDPANSSIPPGDEQAVVVRVVDGDTLVVELDGRRERLRHIGIDAPELEREGGAVPAGCWSDEASAAHAGLVRGTVLRLERDVSDRDRFGRLLRHAWLASDGGWAHVGEELVRSGAARARSYPPDTAHDARLREVEEAARAGRRGLWGAC